MSPSLKISTTCFLKIFLANPTNIIRSGEFYSLDIRQKLLQRQHVKMKLEDRFFETYYRGGILEQATQLISHLSPACYRAITSSRIRVDSNSWTNYSNPQRHNLYMCRLHQTLLQVELERSRHVVVAIQIRRMMIIESGPISNKLNYSMFQNKLQKSNFNLGITIYRHLLHLTN